MNRDSGTRERANNKMQHNNRVGFFFLFFFLKFLHTTYKTNTGTLFYNSLQFLTLKYDTNTNATLLTQKLIIKLHKKEKLFLSRVENSETESTKLGLLNYH